MNDQEFSERLRKEMFRVKLSLLTEHVDARAWSTNRTECAIILEKEGLSLERAVRACERLDFQKTKKNVFERFFNSFFGKEKAFNS